jgi:hypothetical protein
MHFVLMAGVYINEGAEKACVCNEKAGVQREGRYATSRQVCNEQAGVQ